jgi:23S rRNA pseudouridine1911/1915/1917 synthase
MIRIGGFAIEILYEDNHLLAINKPALLPTMGVESGRLSALELAKDYIKVKYSKPGNVFLGVVSRLDSPVTGVLVFARTSKAAARLSEQFADRKTEKTYWALVAGHVRPKEGLRVDWVCKDEAHHRMSRCRTGTPGGQEARLHYRVLREFDAASLVEVSLETGRKHQIRVQLAAMGHPILGDQKYGSREPFREGIGLHARRLVLEHPVRREPLEIISPAPKSWRQWETEPQR